MSTKSTLWYLNDDSLKYDDVVNQLNEKNFNLNSEHYPDFELVNKKHDQTLNLSGGEVLYTLYDYSIASQVGNRIHNQLIVFEQNGQIGFVVDKSKAGLAFIRALLGYESAQKGVVISARRDDSFFDGYLFFWIISRIYYGESQIDFDSDDKNSSVEDASLSFNSLDGVKGKTVASLNTVTTEGSDVIKMLTTLSFLLESDRLTEVSLVTTYKEHTSLKVELRSTRDLVGVDVDLKSYDGPYRDQENDELVLRCKLLLLAHLDLLPTIQILFKNDNADEDIKKDLAVDIANNIKKRLDRLLEELDAE